MSYVTPKINSSLSDIGPNSLPCSIHKHKVHNVHYFESFTQ
jgi:hypothetical protein